MSALARGCFIDGSVEPVGGDTLSIHDPATGELVGTVTAATASDVDRAVRSAHAAFAEWSRRSITDRAKILRAGAELLDARAHELAPGLTAEQGKPLREARMEIRKAADTLDHYASMGKDVRASSVHQLDPGVDGTVLRRPLGVLLATMAVVLMAAIYVWGTG